MGRSSGLIRAYESEVYAVAIDWSAPMTYEEVAEMEYEDLEQVYFYKIVSRFGSKHELLYIGKIFRQYVSVRLLNKDHVRKKEQLKEKYPRHKIEVSLGTLSETNAKRTAGHIDEIESLLIYIHDDMPRLENRQKRWRHGIAKDYHIINNGFLDDGMVREIALGLFYKS